MIRYLRAALALLLFASTASAAPRIRELRPDGGGGGAPFRVTCPPGQWLVGFGGSAGAWIDHIKILCAVRQNNRSMGPASPVQVMIGDSFEGRGLRVVCPRDSSIKRIQFNTVIWSGHTILNHITGVCTRVLNDGLRETIHFAPRDGQSRFADQSCPGSMRAIGVHGRHGKYVDAIGLICSDQFEGDLSPVLVPQKAK